MKIYGTRGSVPVCRRDIQVFGGNTTCLRVMSDALPLDTALVIDAGTGFVPLSHDLLASGVQKILLLFSHWHHDHTQGLFLAPHLFHSDSLFHILGPSESDYGPYEVLNALMGVPFFPVQFQNIESRFTCIPLQGNVGQRCIVIHRDLGMVFSSEKSVAIALDCGDFVHQGQKVSIKECLVIRLFRANHPQFTLSYRLEDYSSGGSTFVFLTDHENTEEISDALRTHVENADLLIQDCQYSRERYDTKTKGFGHSTPDYCAELSIVSGVRSLGITHHDPEASDDEVRQRLAETVEQLRLYRSTKSVNKVFACADYMEVEIGE